MTDEKKPSFKGFNSEYLPKVGEMCILGGAMSGSYFTYPGTVLQVRLFRAGKKTSRQTKLFPQIADRLPRVERIKTDIILTCILGVVLQISNLRYIRPKGTGVNYYLKNLKAS